jgi:hypothetical protein
MFWNSRQLFLFLIILLHCTISTESFNILDPFSAMGTVTSQVLNSKGEIATSIFEFKVPNVAGEATTLESYRGKKAYVVVNVASQ